MVFFERMGKKIVLLVGTGGAWEAVYGALCLPPQKRVRLVPWDGQRRYVTF
jgi:hypothetical protein